jgi:hypothetical protein
MLGITFVMSAVLGEVGLRIIGFQFPDFYEFDAEAGWKHRPNYSAWQRQEGEALVETNGDGFRDKARTQEKAAGTFRIAVLGDSFTEAHQVALEEMFTSKLETKLGACGALAGKKVEVLNFGASSYGTNNEYLLMQRDVWKYKPDVVMLAFTTGNDFEDNVYALAGAKARPYLKLEGGKLVVDQSQNVPLSTGQRLWHGAQNVSRLLQFVQRYRMVLAARKRIATAGGNLMDVGLSDAVYKPPATPEWQEAWTITKATLDAMAKESKAHGAAFVLTTLTNSIQAHPDPATRDAFMQKLGVTDLFYPDDQLAAFAKERGFAAITLSRAMQAHATKTNTCLHGFSNAHPCAGHWNAKGHELASDLMANGLCSALPGPIPTKVE